MKKFLKKHFGAILLIVPCLFMALNFYFSPYRLGPKGVTVGNLLNCLFVTPSICLMVWFICWEVKRSLGKEYSMEKTFIKYMGFILFATLIPLLVCAVIFSPNKPRIRDIPSVLDDPIVFEILTGTLVVLVIYLTGWGQDLTAKWSLSSKLRRLHRIQKEFEHVRALKQDPEKLILELARALTTALLCLALSIAGGVLATAFLVMLAISLQLDSSGSTSAFPGLLPPLSPTYVAITEGSITLFNGVLLSFGIKACLGALKLMANVKDFQIYQGKVEKGLTKLNLSIKSG